MTSPLFAVPPDLVTSIVQGRCVAFVGAGFSAPVVPTWTELLKLLATRLELTLEIPPGCDAFMLEALGDQLQRHARTAWEPAVQAVLAEAQLARADRQAEVERRRAHLLQIPFKAILTTNFDPSLTATYDALDPTVYGAVLRAARPRWWSAPPSGGRMQQPPVLKLHGDANGRADRLPLVLARRSYRELVYKDRNYANFLRSVFAEYTVLFLGVSFTDAYLNELRSEILNLVHGEDHETPWGYAVLNKPTPAYSTFLRKVEGIEVLRTEEFEQFDDWLAAIADRTSIVGRLRRVFQDDRPVVWVDAHHEANNTEGHALLRDALGASGQSNLILLSSPDQLDEQRHGHAAVILTSFGHKEGRAFALLERTRTWAERPPVIVFAAAGPSVELAENRRACLRRGAWEFTTQWHELYRAIELAVARVPGKPDEY